VPAAEYLGVETLTRDVDATGDDQDAAARLSAVVLRFAGARYAVDMAAVAEVVPVPPVTRLPGGPAWLSGVVNWRGRVLPVLDLRPLVGASLAPLPTSARLVVLSLADVECGVVADLVPGLLECAVAAVEPVPATAASEIGGLVHGIVDDDGPVAVLDAASVLSLREQLPHTRRAAR
jgi:purine-binding chemotaxis protein CheW